MSSMLESPALQVIVLGSGGGPREDNTTAFLVRATSTEWRRGSVLAVDAGTHLAAIARILDRSVADGNLQSLPATAPMVLTSGPFTGLQLPCLSVEANAAHITRHLIDTFLITHPHLDHIAGFVINTAGLPSTRPKRLAALPATISAFKAHIFNNVIWPNLSDENNGVGLVTYMRLVDGGSPALGEGDGKGYVEICEGLSVKSLSLSHGHCMENHSHRGSVSGVYPYDCPPENDRSPQRSNSYSVNNGKVAISPGGYGRKPSLDRVCVYDSAAYFIRDIATGREVLIFGDVEPDSISLSPRNQLVWADAAPKIVSGMLKAILIECSYTDSQRDDQLYGHLVPRYLFEELRTLAVYVDAVRQDDAEKKRRKRKRTSSPHAHSQSPRRSPRVSHAGPASAEPPSRSRRSLLESSSGNIPNLRPVELDGAARDAHTSSPTTHPVHGPSPAITTSGRLAGPAPPLLASFAAPAAAPSAAPPSFASVLDDSDPNNRVLTLQQQQPPQLGQQPLKGLQVFIVHVKETLEDAEPAGHTIMRQLRAFESKENLGCEFVLTSPGLSIFC